MAQSTRWTSYFGFLAAAAGFAVGLGNIWRFPYVVGENGGSAFVLVYLLCVLLIGVPILMAELMLGRRGRSSASGVFAALATAEGRSPKWRWVGGLTLVTAFLILMVYCVVAGWVFHYGVLATQNGFAGLDAAGSQELYRLMLADERGMVFYTVVGLLMTCAILYFGVAKGVERAVRWLMPTLLVLLVALAAINLFAGEVPGALAYLFTPDFSKLNASVLLAAVAQAFFSIGVAMAGMMAFGAYLPRNVSIPISTFIVVCVDTLVALLAGLVIFPLVFEYGLDPAGGAGLIFETLPIAFGQLPLGQVIGSAFFLLLAVAAVTSMVGLMEPLVVWCEEDLGVSRELGVVLVGSAVWICGMVSVLSYNQWAGWQFAGKNLSGWLDFIPNQVLLPVGGLLIALFAGWFVSTSTSRKELALRHPIGFGIWLVLIRGLVPPAILAILVGGLLAS